MAPVLEKELADKVDAYPEFEPVMEDRLAIAHGVAKSWREAPVPKSRCLLNRRRAIVYRGLRKFSLEDLSFMSGGVAMGEDED